MGDTTTKNNNNLSKEDELNIKKQLIRKIFEDGLIWFRLSGLDKVSCNYLILFILKEIGLF